MTELPDPDNLPALTPINYRVCEDGNIHLILYSEETKRPAGEVFFTKELLEFMLKELSPGSIQ